MSVPVDWGQISVSTWSKCRHRSHGYCLPLQDQHRPIDERRDVTAHIPRVYKATRPGGLQPFHRHGELLGSEARASAAADVAWMIKGPRLR